MKFVVFMTITDTECFGKVTTKLRPLRSVLLLIETASGLEKSFAACSDGAVMVFNSARAAGMAPAIVILVSSELVRLVFTALIKIVLPSAVRLPTASRKGMFVPSRDVSKVGLLTVVANN